MGIVGNEAKTPFALVAEGLEFRHEIADAGFEALRRQQNAAGYGPDSSLSTADRLMQSFLGRAEAALAAGDAASAKKFMDQAEPQIEILERRFGR